MVISWSCFVCSMRMETDGDGHPKTHAVVLFLPASWVCPRVAELLPCRRSVSPSYHHPMSKWTWAKPWNRADPWLRLDRRLPDGQLAQD